MIDDELLVDRLVLHLRVRLDVAEIGSAGGIVGRVADHAERQAAVGAAEQALPKHVLQECQLRRADAAEQVRGDHLTDILAHAGGKCRSDVIGQAGIVVAVDCRIGRRVVPAAHAPEVAARLRIGDHVDARAQAARQDRPTSRKRSGPSPVCRLLAADDAVQRLVQAGLLGREIGQAPRGEALWRYQADRAVDLVGPPQPVAEHQLGGIAVQPRLLLDGDGVLDGVAGRAGEDHVDAFLQPELGLRRPVVRIVGVRQQGNAAALAAQRVHAGARRNIDARRALLPRHRPRRPSRRSSSRGRWRTRLGAIVAPPALATTNCEGPRCGPCP